MSNIFTELCNELYTSACLRTCVSYFQSLNMILPEMCLNLFVKKEDLVELIGNILL